MQPWLPASAAIIFYRSLLQAGSTAPVDELVAALARRHVNAIPIFCTSLKDATCADTVASLLDEGAADLVINATPVGMNTEAGEMPCDPDFLRGGLVVADLIYAPRETAWMRAASEKGATAVNGLSMLVFQAATQFTLWTGEPAPIPQMLSAVERALAD